MKINSIIDLVKDLDTSRQTKNLNKLLIRILLHLQVEFSVFYYTLSNVYQNWKNSIFIQSTIQNIGADKYSVMPIIIPPLSEQQSIADYLDRKCSEIDELISIKQQKIEKLKDYKKSLIFECVTGKRKV